MAKGIPLDLACLMLAGLVVEVFLGLVPEIYFCFPARFQPVGATHWLNRSAGVSANKDYIQFAGLRAGIILGKNLRSVGL